jgi:Mce-associated membrane protein
MTVTRRWLVLVLAVLVLVAGGLTAWLATRPEPDSHRPEISKEDGTYRAGSLPSDEAEDAVKAAARAMELALALDYRKLDEGLSDATQLMTDSFVARFSSDFNKLARTRALKKKAVTSALVRGAGLVRMEGDDEAYCLVYVNQVLLETKNLGKDSKPIDVSQNRVQVGLKKVGGDWLVDSIQPF